MLISYKKPRGRFFIVGKGGSGPVPPTPSQPNDEIWYTSTDDQVVTPNQPGGIQDADGNTLNILSNTYENGKGVIKLDGDVASFVPVGSDGVFDSCATLASVSIPDSVTSIGNYTFYGCSNLASVTIGNSVTSFGTSAFQGCNSLSYVNYTGTVDQWCEIDFANNYSNPTRYAKTLSINGSLLTEVVISDTVTSIGKYAFYNCENITSVTVGNSVTTIGFSAFSGCSGMTSATIGSSVTTIGDDAFRGCSGLTSATIGSSVASIGDSAFYNCTSLVAIESLPTTAPSISKFTFKNVAQNGVLTVHNADYSTWMSTGDYYLGKYNWTCVGGLNRITVNVNNGNGTLSVNGTQVTLDANNDWVGLYSDGDQVILSMSVDSAHSFCCWYDRTNQLWADNNYTSYDNPVTIEMHGTYNIETQIDTLLNVTLLGASGQGKVGWSGQTPDYSATKTGMHPGMCEDIYAYPETGYEFVEWQSNDFTLDSPTANPSYVCPNNDGTITAVFQPVTPQQPNDEVWYTTSNSQTIAPYNLKGVNNNNLTVVSNTYSGGKGVMKMSGDIYGTANSFVSQPTLTSMSLPSTMTSIGTSCFNACSSLASISMPDTITSIGNSCFVGTTALTSVTLPSLITAIGTSMFERSGISSISIPTGVTSIATYAFKNCSSLVSITFESTTTVPTIGGTSTFDGVASTGTVYGQPGLDYSAVMTKLPSGWTLVQ